MNEEQFVRELQRLIRRVEKLERVGLTKYKGTQAGDFTTTTLPHHGDYGFQTTDSELQINCNGTVLKTTMGAL